MSFSVETTRKVLTALTKGPLPQDDVAEAAGIDPQEMSDLVDFLEEAGWVELSDRGRKSGPLMKADPEALSAFQLSGQVRSPFYLTGEDLRLLSHLEAEPLSAWFLAQRMDMRATSLVELAAALVYEGYAFLAAAGYGFSRRFSITEKGRQALAEAA